jgi:hypothetical protein
MGSNCGSVLSQLALVTSAEYPLLSPFSVEKGRMFGRLSSETVARKMWVRGSFGRRGKPLG